MELKDSVLAEKIEKSLELLREAAATIDPSRLEVIIADCNSIYSDLQPVNFFFHLNKALSQVSFPWVKMLNQSPLSTLIDFPLSHIPQHVYTTSVDWIKQRTLQSLWKFVKYAFDRIVKAMTLEDAQVPTFVTLAMILRARPDALDGLLPVLRVTPMYQGEDKLPLIVWMTAQASQGDVSAGLYAWAHNLLPLLVDKKPLLVDKKGCSPKSIDLILQLVENILFHPEAPTILVDRAVTDKGERLIPPSSFEILLRLTFARAKTTARFEAIYPYLKDVALAPGSNAMKQILTLSLKLAGQRNRVLAKEATSIAIWCLTENVDCFKHWDSLYMENLQVIVDKWKDHSLKLSLSPRDTLTLDQTVKSFRRKNLKAITQGEANCSLYKEADKFCKVILGRHSRGSGGLILTIITAVVGAAIGAATTAFVLSSQNHDEGFGFIVAKLLKGLY